MTSEDHTLVSTIMTSKESIAAELCSNWWPEPRLALAETAPGMPHPLCRVCANWLPDIEDIGIILNSKSGCGNDWSKERNQKKTQ